MRALEWHGNADVRVVERDIPSIVDPTDVLLRVTSTAICGSDLHLYHNEVPGMKKGDVLGHEFMGIIDEVGSAVKSFKRGDRVVCSFLISCGHCYYCVNGMYSNCDAGNPNKETDDLYGHRSSGKFGYSHLTGGFSGGQAEWVRVPFADNCLLKIPDGIPDEKVLLLSDVACTGYHATELGGVTRNQTVAVWGCGPVGLTVLACAKLRGAARIIAIDGDSYRLEFARNKIGAEVIDFSKDDVLKTLRELCPNGPDVCIDSAGFRFPKSLTERFTRALSVTQRDSSEILRECIFAVRKGGTVSIVGDYFTEASHFPIGAFFDKGLNMRAGQTHVQRYWHHLLDCIKGGEFDPSFIISHIMLLDRAADAYRLFDKHDHACIKVLLKTPLGLTLSREHGTAVVSDIGAAVRPHMTPVAITQQAVYIDPGVIGGMPFPQGTAAALSAQEELVGVLPTTSGSSLSSSAIPSAAGTAQVHRVGGLGAEGDEIQKQHELTSQVLADNQRAPIDGAPTGFSSTHSGIETPTRDTLEAGSALGGIGELRFDVTPASYYAMTSSPDVKTESYLSTSKTELGISPTMERGEGLPSVQRGLDIKAPGSTIAEQAINEGRDPEAALDTWRQDPKVDI